MTKLATMTFLLLTAGCGGNRADTARMLSPDSQPGLAPVERVLPLDTIKSVSLEDADRFCNGADYASELPSQRVTPQGTQLLFSPSWDEGGEPGPSDLAFAMYDFSLDGYDDLPELAMHWETSAADWSQLVTVEGPAANLGRSPSLAVAYGNPAIAYIDYGTSDLKYVRASTSGGANQADWSQIETLDTEARYNNWRSSSMIAINGNPAVCYTGENSILSYAYYMP